MKRLIACLALVALLATMPGGCAKAAVAAALSLPERRTVHVLMYHSILRDPERAGKYVLSPEALETDLCWLLAHGYETVTAEALAAFADGEGSLPERPVLLTFDDGYLNNLTYVLPILKKYGCHAVVSVVGAYTQRFTDENDPNPNYAHLCWDEVRALAESGLVEIGNHTYDLHGQSGRKGCGRKQGESARDYERMLLSDVERLQQELTARADVTPIAFAYPYGVIDPLSEQILRELGFRVTLSCCERPATVIFGQSESLFAMGRYNRPSGVLTETFMARVFAQ